MTLEIIPSAGQLTTQGSGYVVGKAHEAGVPTSVRGAAREAGIPTSIDEAGRVVKNEITQRFGLPPIPSPQQIPKLVAEQISKEMGIPIPTELSVDSLLSLANKIPNLPFPLPIPFPSNIKQGVEFGLKTAAQLLGPQVLASIGLGSVVPGIGNIVGIAFAFASLIAASLKRPPYKQRYACIPSKDFIQKFRHFPHVGTSMRTFGQNNISALGMAYTQAVLHEARGCVSGKVCTNAVVLGVEGSRKPGAGGRAILKDGPWTLKDYNETSVYQCITDSEEQIRRLFKFVSGQTQDLTLPQVQAALAMFDYVTQQGGRLETNAQQYVGQLRSRLQQLQKITDEYASWLKGPHAGAGERLTFNLSREMRTAAVATQMSGYRHTGEVYSSFWFDTNLAQFALIASIVAKLRQAEAERIKAMHATQERRRVVGETRTKQDPKAAEISTLRAGCITGHQPSCERLRQMGGTPVSAPRPAPPAPTRPPMVQLPPTPAPQPGADAARIFCLNLYNGWVQQNPRLAACLTPMDKAWILQFCYDAHGPTKRWTVPEAMSRIQTTIAAACKRKGIAV